MANQEIREHNEQRQLGAVALIHRQRQGTTPFSEILLMRDVAKVETVAGLQEWNYPSQAPWGLPGGGRGNQKARPNGRIYPENLASTIYNETKEELGVSLQLLASTLAQQAYPIIAAQLQESEKRTDEFAVTSVWVEYDSLSRTAQRKLDSEQQQDQVTWQMLEFLAMEYQSEILFARERKRKKSLSIGYRPHALAAAYVWYLEKICGRSAEELQRELQEYNQKTHRFIYQDAAQRSQNGQLHQVNNGIFQADGTLLPTAEMNFRDRRYLLRPTQSK